MALRKSDGFLLFIGSAMALLAVLVIQAHFVTQTHLPLLRQKAEVVSSLGLTDLCLCTEARYTRHLSQADWHAAFQSYPAALDHFPSGSILGPPPSLQTPHAQVH